MNNLPTLNNSASEQHAETIKNLSTWYGIAPPDEIALVALDDLALLIARLEQYRGQLSLLEDPAYFSSVLHNISIPECKENE